MAHLHFLGEDENPYGIVCCLMNAVASGSSLVVWHLTAEIQPENMSRLAPVVEDNPLMSYRFVMRAHSQIARFLDGLDLVDPGLVAIDEWRPEHSGPVTYPDGVGRPPFYAAIARRP